MKASTPGAAGDHPHSLGTADGRLPDGATVRDTLYPGVARLDPELRAALRAATADAADDGVRIRLESGWRSRAYQAHLLADAVSQYGSAAEAARWVATPDTSPHVGGDAVDVGPADAMTWLARHGEEYGLCRVYANEPWHVELREDAARDGCPAPYADPTHDPRMAR
ncbi:M15 family metallopeptidase [Phycicoccus sp. HDW14]|uniref:M15 family metallopeptidase n=1 Tax=Phycicoccus sp. HDW14 TaxID=2714941 RepID=UPI0014090B82|nr:M15 family metallopeptidase [Phycicoccus sp. HDW14]QIM19972.1 M15 family metallopeptidase [Phycicoccus sp. HDW14]